MLLMVEKGIREGICHAIYLCAKANSKYMEGYDKNKESSYLKYLDVNNLYGWEMSQNNMDDIFENIEEYNPNTKRKILIAFDDMSFDMHSYKKLNPIVTELYIRGRKLNISLVCITEY